MKKTIAIALSLLLVCSSLAMMLVLPAHAESLYIRKIVSVVYDDSGSMEDDNKWSFANYAMQAFCGMLNSEDKLFITYMSDAWAYDEAVKQNNENSQFYNEDPSDTPFEPQEMNLSSGGIQNSVDSIHYHTNTASTPFSSVKYAYDKLQSVEDSNPNTQYWLVVITDGDFDEIKDEQFGETPEQAKERKKEFLNESMEKFLGTEMKNQSRPQVTFLTIGNNVIPPDEDTQKGLYTFHAADANEITEAMSSMADRISGRTRLQKQDITQMDDTTVQVSSSIPLLNIAVFSQNSDAVVTSAAYGNEMDIPVTRKADLAYPLPGGDLYGSAVLLGDSQKVIGAGTYTITFDKKISLEDVVVLFEPALEMRVSVTLNGREIASKNELSDASVGDRIAASCKIYEMGTDTEVDPSLLPPGTGFDITLRQNGDVVRHTDSKEMKIDEYELQDADTNLHAAVSIEGFNPIEYNADFHPKDKPDVVTVSADYLNQTKSIKLDQLASNSELAISFTISLNGERITDPDEVKAYHPVISTSVPDNDGDVTYSDDGRIIFTPRYAGGYEGGADSFDVTVTCTLDNGESAGLTYTVLISDYAVIPIDAEDAVRKTEFYENQIGASFYILKDGVRLGKSQVEKDISVSLNEPYAKLKTKISVADDGLITVVPYDEEEHEINFGSWWGNWWYYWFELSNDDVVITLQHPYGTADAKIKVTGATTEYLIRCVWLPLAVEIFLLIWLLFILIKPKFKGGSLYVGYLLYDEVRHLHILSDFNEYRLRKFRRKGLFSPKPVAKKVNVGGIMVRAAYKGRIIVESPTPWYRDTINPYDINQPLNTPADICDYLMTQTMDNSIPIREIRTDNVVPEDNRYLDHQYEQPLEYTVISTTGEPSEINGRLVIESGWIFIYQ